MKLSGFIFFIHSFNKNVSCPYYMPSMMLGDVIEDKELYGLLKKIISKIIR